MHTAVSSRISVQTLAHSAICAALIVICSWISIPMAVPFTLQTFAMFLTCDLMGGAAVLPVLLYMLLGAVGLPVFSGFNGGLAALMGPTGGYILGFLAIVLLTAVWKKLMGGRWPLAGMLAGLAVCYLFGTVWFVRVYTGNGNTVTFAQALAWCVLPYIIPDVLKLLLARLVGARVKAALKGMRQ